MTRTKKTARKSTAQQKADNTPSMAIVSEDAMKVSSGFKSYNNESSFSIKLKN